MELNEEFIAYFNQEDDKQRIRSILDHSPMTKEAAEALNNSETFDRLYAEAVAFGLNINLSDYMMIAVSAPDEIVDRLKKALQENPADSWGNPVEKDHILTDFVSTHRWETLGADYLYSIRHPEEE